MENAYARLLGLMAINLVVMFAVTYLTVWEWGHVHANINRFYMALLMVAPMGMLMLVAMGHMFGNKRLSYALQAFFAAIAVLTFLLIRTQTPVGDDQFLRSMIPHHSAAILMCERSTLSDPEIVQLCEKIVRSQQEEITQMEQILSRRQ